MKEGCPVGQYEKKGKCIPFKDTKFMNARDKSLVLNNYRSFLDTLEKSPPNTFRKFTKRLYKHLHLNYGFIAHYDREGFWATYFKDPERSLEFLTKILEYNYFPKEYTDINQAMREITMEKYPNIKNNMKFQQKHNDISQAKTLLAKHGLSLKDSIPMDEVKKQRFEVKEKNNVGGIAIWGVYDNLTHRWIDYPEPPDIADPAFMTRPKVVQREMRKVSYKQMAIATAKRLNEKYGGV